MAAPTPPSRALRIRCHDFAREDVDGLRSLLGLLKDYLKQACVVTDVGPADLVFVNLDRPAAAPDYPGARLVGCAVKPRLQAAGSIHRPFRAAEVLAVLSELSSACATDEREAIDEEGNEWRYRLRCWPVEFAHWSRESWRVMATITRRHCSLQEIATRTGMARKEVASVLCLLRRMDLLDRLVERRALPRVDESLVPGWRGLAARVGQLLGFAR